MARRSNLSSIIVFGVVLLGFAFFLYHNNKSEKFPKTFNWWPDYGADSRQPYGTVVLEHLLKSTYGADSVSYFSNGVDGFAKISQSHGAYFFIGHNVNEDAEFVDSLLSYVSSGNEAMILSESFSFEFLNKLLLERCHWLDAYYKYLDSFDEEVSLDSLGDTPVYEPDSAVVWDNYSVTASGVSLRVMDETGAMRERYQVQRLFKNQPADYDWEFIHDTLLCADASNFKVLGYLNDSLINFVRFDVGNGQVYLNSTPLAFTNHNLLHGETVPYAQQVFSFLRTRRLFWDQTEPYDYPSNSNRVAWHQGPLYYVLSQTPLAIAWYILLGMAILFVLFRAKRRQRVIPVLEENSNTSLEFIENIGRLYFLSEDYRHLLLLKMQLFLSYVRDQYRMPTNELGQAFRDKLAMRAGVDAGILENILVIHKNVVNSKYVSQNTLISFHKALDKFYLESRR